MARSAVNSSNLGRNADCVLVTADTATGPHFDARRTGHDPAERLAIIGAKVSDAGDPARQPHL